MKYGTFLWNNELCYFRILNPLVFGDYPKVMKQNAGSRLPSFNKHQSKQLKGSFDFIGLNHYTSVYVKDNSNGLKPSLRDFNADMFALLSGLIL